MPMDFDSLNETQHNEAIRKRLAMLMAHDCFRNTKLERLPRRNIPVIENRRQFRCESRVPFRRDPMEGARLSDEEMKILMIDVVNQCYKFLSELFVSAKGEAIIETLKQRDPVAKRAQ